MGETKDQGQTSREPAALIGRAVVVDCRGWFIYAGQLESVGEHWLALTDADMHDHRESNSTRERYIMEIAKHGVRKNRERVFVRMDMVVSMSALDDVTVY